MQIQMARILPNGQGPNGHAEVSDYASIPNIPGIFQLVQTKNKQKHIAWMQIQMARILPDGHGPNGQDPGSRILKPGRSVGRRRSAPVGGGRSAVGRRSVGRRSVGGRSEVGRRSVGGRSAVSRPRLVGRRSVGRRAGGKK